MKKTLLHPKANKEEQRVFLSKIEEYKKGLKTIIYIDESGFASDMPRLYGCAAKGKRCYGLQNYRERGRQNVIGAICENTFVAQSIFDCSVNSDVFYAWTTQDLLPALEKLNKSCVIVMDNASFHKRLDIVEAIKNAGHILFFQPAYSPELNPIEKKWAQAKHFIRKFQCSVDEVFKCHLSNHLFCD